MPTPVPNRFTSYDFTEEERKSAEVLNPLQKMHLQSEVAKIAQQILNLDAGSRENLPDFEIQRAFLKGQMTSLEYILQLSAAREINIVEEQSNHDYIIDAPTGPNLYSHFTQPPQEDSNQFTPKE